VRWWWRFPCSEIYQQPKQRPRAAGVMTVVVVLATPPTLTDPGTNPPTQLSPSAPSTSKTSRTKAHPRTDRTGISSLVSGAGRARLPTLRLGYKEGWNENLAARYPVYRAWGDERWEMGEEKNCGGGLGGEDEGGGGLVWRGWCWGWRQAGVMREKVKSSSIVPFCP